VHSSPSLAWPSSRASAECAFLPSHGSRRRLVRGYGRPGPRAAAGSGPNPGPWDPPSKRGTDDLSCVWDDCHWRSSFAFQRLPRSALFPDSKPPPPSSSCPILHAPHPNPHHSPSALFNEAAIIFRWFYLLTRTPRANQFIRPGGTRAFLLMVFASAQPPPLPCPPAHNSPRSESLQSRARQKLQGTTIGTGREWKENSIRNSTLAGARWGWWVGDRGMG
jgi:hypothetical protein